MTEFPNAEDYEQVKGNTLHTSDEVVVHFTKGRRIATYWRRKPQEPTYTPSPEAVKLSDDMSSAPTWDARNRIIDQALAAARQQGRDEGYADGHEAGVVKTMFDLQPDGFHETFNWWERFPEGEAE